jgi:hypothetical protein
VIECRDGLVRISPYLGENDGADPRELAELLRRALRERGSGETAPAHAVAVAIPEGEGLDADVHELEAISNALRSGS